MIAPARQHPSVSAGADNFVMETARTHAMLAAQTDTSGPEPTSASGRLVARNTIWNLVGQAAPLIVAVLALPYVIRHLGTARYGVLAIAWAVIGYFGIFDLGLGSALTKMLADRPDPRGVDQATLLWSGLLLLGAFGAIGGIVMAAISGPLAYRWLNVPVELRAETRTVFRIFAIAMPAVVTLGALRGALAAFHRFDVINKVRIPLGVLSFAAPLFVLPFTRSLVPIVGLLALFRVANWIVFASLCLKVVPGLTLRPAWSVRAVRPLLSFGGWITVCNVIDPIFTYADRFILASVLSMSAVAYYATPFDVVTKLWILPDAMTAALFPAFAESLSARSSNAAWLLDRSATFLFPSLFAPVIAIVIFAPEMLRLWLGHAFAIHSAPVLRWLAAGVLINTMARAPYAILQAAHRPDLPAKLNMFESPFYIAGLIVMIHLFGLEGAAIAWTLRMVLNASVMNVMTWRLLPGCRAAVAKHFKMLVLAALPMTCAPLLPAVLWLKFAFLVGSLALMLAVTWYLLLSPEERFSLRAALPLGARVQAG
jgi:O-antigen/teichoic acid export membrane protein